MERTRRYTVPILIYVLIQSIQKNLSVYDDEKISSYIPHVVETSVGVERLLLALLCHAYCEENDEDGETRIVLKIT